MGSGFHWSSNNPGVMEELMRKSERKEIAHLRMVKYWKTHGEMSFSFAKVI